MNQDVSRRRFLKTLSAVGGGAAGATVSAATAGVVRGADGPSPGSADLERRYGRDAGEWIASCCNACGGQCGIMAHVIEGKVVKIEPNPWNPNNYANISSDFFANYDPAVGVRDGAAIFPKGNAATGLLYDPDRVQQPRKRTNPKKGREGPRLA